MEKKITKREVINTMLADEAIVSNEVYVNYLNHELELLDKKSSNRKPTKTQEANVTLKADIKAVLKGVEGGMVATDIVKALEADVTVQKVSALLTQMVKSNEVVKTVDKRKSVFSLPN